jgi:LmbE family N-acetylglucosaminyl deacetylase
VLVVAPHPDDEVLGCGGTIARMAAQGRQVAVLILTDGATSHRSFVGEATVRRMRAEEAVAAATALGVPPPEQLGLPDGALTAHLDEAVAAVTGRIRAFSPGTVLTTWGRDPHPDHRAASAAVRRAVARARTDALLAEFPVWHWHRLPWTRSGPGPGSGSRPRQLARALADAGGLRTVGRFPTAVDVRETLARKWAALSCYRSQMVACQPGWPTLPGVAEGTWLARFFTGVEVFHTVRTSTGD